MVKTILYFVMLSNFFISPLSIAAGRATAPKLLDIKVMMLDKMHQSSYDYNFVWEGGTEPVKFNYMYTDIGIYVTSQGQPVDFGTITSASQYNGDYNDPTVHSGLPTGWKIASSGTCNNSIESLKTFNATVPSAYPQYIASTNTAGLDGTIEFIKGSYIIHIIRYISQEYPSDPSFTDGCSTNAGQFLSLEIATPDYYGSTAFSLYP